MVTIVTLLASMSVTLVRREAAASVKVTPGVTPPFQLNSVMRFSIILCLVADSGLTPIPMTPIPNLGGRQIVVQMGRPRAGQAPLSLGPIPHHQLRLVGNPGIARIPANVNVWRPIHGERLPKL